MEPSNIAPEELPDLIKEKVEERKELTDEKTKKEGFDVCLPLLGVSYNCSLYHIPISLPSVRIEGLSEHRSKMIAALRDSKKDRLNEGRLHRERLPNYFPDIDQSADVLLDCAHLFHEDSQDKYTVFLSYSTSSDNAFLQQYIDTFQEIWSMSYCRNVSRVNSCADFHQMVDDHLSRNFNINSRELEAKIDLKKIDPGYDGSESSHAVAIYKGSSMNILGPLAVMDQDAESFFGILEQAHIGCNLESVYNKEVLKQIKNILLGN